MQRSLIKLVAEREGYMVILFTSITLFQKHHSKVFFPLALTKNYRILKPNMRVNNLIKLFGLVATGEHVLFWKTDGTS